MIAAGMEDATPERPIYKKLKSGLGGPHSNFWAIECNEGWRSSIVCTGMYEWAADWLLGVLGRQPFAPNDRLAGSA